MDWSWAAEGLYMLGALLCLILFSVKVVGLTVGEAVESESEIKPSGLLPVFHKRDYCKKVNKIITRSAWDIQYENVCVVTETEHDTAGHIWYLESVKVVAGCFPLNLVKSSDLSFYDVTANLDVSDMCVSLTVRSQHDILISKHTFNDMRWRQYLTKVRVYCPRSLKRILKAWLLCCKRPPLRGLPKDLRYLMCDYIVKNWKQMSD